MFCRHSCHFALYLHDIQKRALCESVDKIMAQEKRVDSSTANFPTLSDVILCHSWWPPLQEKYECIVSNPSAQTLIPKMPLRFEWFDLLRNFEFALKSIKFSYVKITVFCIECLWNHCRFFWMRSTCGDAIPMPPLWHYQMDIQTGPVITWKPTEGLDWWKIAICHIPTSQPVISIAWLTLATTLLRTVSVPGTYSCHQRHCFRPTYNRPGSTCAFLTHHWHGSPLSVNFPGAREVSRKNANRTFLR